MSDVDAATMTEDAEPNGVSEVTVVVAPKVDKGDDQLDGRGDGVESSLPRVANPSIVPPVPPPRPHHKVYLDRGFLLYLKDKPYCQQFPEHIFYDPDMPVVCRHSGKGRMTRTDLERVTKHILDCLMDHNLDSSVKKLNDLPINDSSDANVVVSTLFERAIENPKLVAKLCANLSGWLFNTLLRQCAIELDLERGFDELRSSLNADYEITGSEMKQQLLNELLAKEKQMKRRYATISVFIAEMYNFGALVKPKMLFAAIYKLINMWLSKREEIYAEALETVLNDVLWRFEDRARSGNSYFLTQHITTLISDLEELSVNPNVPERLRFLISDALNARYTMGPQNHQPPLAYMAGSPMYHGYVPCYMNTHNACLAQHAPYNPYAYNPAYAAAAALVSASQFPHFVWCNPPPSTPFATSFVPPPPPPNMFALRPRVPLFPTNPPSLNSLQLRGPRNAVITDPTDLVRYRAHLARAKRSANRTDSSSVGSSGDGNDDNGEMETTTTTGDGKEGAALKERRKHVHFAPSPAHGEHGSDEGEKERVSDGGGDEGCAEEVPAPRLIERRNSI